MLRFSRALAAIPRIGSCTAVRPRLIFPHTQPFVLFSSKSYFSEDDDDYDIPMHLQDSRLMPRRRYLVESEVDEDEDEVEDEDEDEDEEGERYVNTIELGEREEEERRRMERLEKQRRLTMGDTEIEREEQEAREEEERAIAEAEARELELERKQRRDRREQREKMKLEAERLAKEKAEKDARYNTQEAEDFLKEIEEDEELSAAYQDFKKSLTDQEIMEYYAPKHDQHEFKAAILKQANLKKIPTDPIEIHKSYNKLKKRVVLNILKQMIQQAEKVDEARRKEKQRRAMEELSGDKDATEDESMTDEER